jgi:hypothetical protein
MTTTLNDVTKKRESKPESAERQAAAELVRLAKEQGLSLMGPDGLLRHFHICIRTVHTRRPSNRNSTKTPQPANAGRHPC